MNSYFFAQDLSGNLQKVHVMRHAAAQHDSRGAAARSASYSLEDGSALKRIDSDTFQVIGSGALVTVVRE